MPCENTNRIKWNAKHQDIGDRCLTLFSLPALDMGANPRAPGCSLGACPQALFRALVRRHSGVLGWARSLCPNRSLRSFLYNRKHSENFIKFQEHVLLQIKWFCFRTPRIYTTCFLIEQSLRYQIWSVPHFREDLWNTRHRSMHILLCMSPSIFSYGLLNPYDASQPSGSSATWPPQPPRRLLHPVLIQIMLCVVRLCTDPV